MNICNFCGMDMEAEMDVFGSDPLRHHSCWGTEIDAGGGTSQVTRFKVRSQAVDLIENITREWHFDKTDSEILGRN